MYNVLSVVTQCLNKIFGASFKAALKEVKNILNKANSVTGFELLLAYFPVQKEKNTNLLAFQA